MRRFIAPLALGLVLVACQDQQSPDDANRPVTPAPQLDMQVVQHFFFLPPFAPNPNATGVFNGNLFPIVEICQLSGANGTCTGLIGTFTRFGGSKNELIFVVSGSHYGLNWDTGLFNLQNGTWGRITVRSQPGGGRVFGYADVYIDQSKNLGLAASGQAVGVKNGATLSLKFRMENGVFCDNDTECVEALLDSRGGTFTFADGTAGVQAPQGAVKQGEGGTLVIERFHGTPCLPTDYPQYEACLRVKLEGTITTLNSLVDVGFCLEPDGVDVIGELEVGKWDEIDPATLKDLPQTDVSDFITCSSFSSAPQAQGQLARFARATGRFLKPIFGVKEAYAASMAPGPIPFGAGMSDFSRIGAYRPLKIEKVSGDNQEVLPGASVTPTVKVTSKKTGAPAPGIEVTFNVTSGAGVVAPSSVFTSATGEASASWTLALGANSLRADGKNPLSTAPNRPGNPVWGYVTFGGTGIDLSQYKAFILPPIGTNVGTNPAKYATGIPATVSICRVDTATNTCTTDTYGPFTLVDDGSKYQAGWNTPTTLQIGAIYRITVTLAGSFVLSSQSTDSMPLTGGKAKNLNTGTEFSFQIGSNQTLKYSIEKP